MGKAKDKPKDPSGRKDGNFMEEYGYYTENHELTTEDGYILTVQRFLKMESREAEGGESFRKEGEGEDAGSSGKKERKSKPVALLVHGWMVKGDNWCMISPDKGLPYRLLEEGYDVWLANMRGTLLSRKHVSLDPNCRKYWDFTFHEIGNFDMSATIDFILDFTGNESLAYIGHSMGCTVLYVLSACKPEYCSKISIFISLVPPCYGQHIRNLWFKLFIWLGHCLRMSKYLRPSNAFGNSGYDTISPCVPKRFRRKVAGKMIVYGGMIFGGLSRRGVEKERLCRMATEVPSPTSVKLYCHGMQCIDSGEFRQFDHGRRKNLKKYGEPKPPLYEWRNCGMKIAMFYSEGDELCRPDDIRRFLSELPNVVEEVYIPFEDFSHFDVMVGKDAYDLVFKKAIEIIKRYTVLPEVE